MAASSCSLAPLPTAERAASGTVAGRRTQASPFGGDLRRDVRGPQTSWDTHPRARGRQPHVIHKEKWSEARRDSLLEIPRKLR